MLVFAALPFGADGRGIACPFGALGLSSAAAVADFCFPDSGFFSDFKDFSRLGALPAVHIRKPVGCGFFFFFFSGGRAIGGGIPPGGGGGRSIIPCAPGGGGIGGGGGRPPIMAPGGAIGGGGGRPPRILWALEESLPCFFSLGCFMGGGIPMGGGGRPGGIGIGGGLGFGGSGIGHICMVIAQSGLTIDS
jgi:hypothetical protein